MERILMFARTGLKNTFVINHLKNASVAVWVARLVDSLTPAKLMVLLRGFFFISSSVLT